MGLKGSTVGLIISAILSFALAGLMFVIYETVVVPPNPSQLEYLKTYVTSVVEQRDKSARVATYYLDISVEGRGDHLRYYDDNKTRRENILAALTEGGSVEFWIANSSKRPGLDNEVWQIRKGDALLIAYDDKVRERFNGQVLVLMLVIGLVGIGFGLLFKAVRNMRNISAT